MQTSSWNWAAPSTQQEYLVIENVVVPDWIGRKFSDQGPPLYTGPVVRIAFTWTRFGNTYYSPWLIPNTFPAIIPFPRPRVSLTVDFVYHLETGVTATVQRYVPV